MITINIVFRRLPGFLNSHIYVRMRHAYRTQAYHMMRSRDFVYAFASKEGE